MTAVLLLGQAANHIDHLAPLSATLGVPLVVTDAQIGETTRAFYPDVDLHYHTPMELSSLPYTQIISCIPRCEIEMLFQGKKRRFIWSPHGNSDKGEESRIMEVLADEETVFYYGEQMLAMIRRHGGYNPNCRYIATGNYRLAYYEKHRDFYRNIVAEKIPLPKRAKTLLYAPTWNDAEQNGTATEWLPYLIDNLPSDTNLIVKLHPNDLFVMETSLLQLRYTLSHPSLFFLDDFPPIYPLLDIVDGYIGDMSSIGYDFLYFDKPMFFPKKGAFPLQGCGDDLDAFFAGKPERGNKGRRALYEHAFEKNGCLFSAHSFIK